MIISVGFERSLVVGEGVQEGRHRPQRCAHIRMPRVEIIVRTDNLRPLRRRGVGPDLGDHGLQLLEVGQHRLCRPAERVVSAT